MAKTTSETARLFRCRREELGPLNDMVQAMFTTNQADFGKASPDYADPDYLESWNTALKMALPSWCPRACAGRRTRT